MSERDRLYAEPHAMIVDFAFDAVVAQLFPDMIRRSVPGYAEVIALSGLLAGRYAQPGSRLYDLGSSLGATSFAMRRYVRAEGCRIVAVDNAWPMVQRCRALLAAEPEGPPVDLVCADLRHLAVQDASVVVLNFTLQFLPLAERLALLRRIRAGLRPGGVLLMAEKLRSDDVWEEAFLGEAHLAFKAANGYSELEISQKRAALEQVLLPESESRHRERLAQAGFERSLLWFRCLNFAAFAAFA